MRPVSSKRSGNAGMNAATSPFDPVTIGPLTLRNRFIKSGANEAMCMDGRPTKALVRHHRELAQGGIAMTTVAYMAVAPEARTLPNQIWMHPDILPDLRALTDAVHGEGAAISAQITHGGSFVTGMKVKGRTISSSGGLNPAGMLKGNFLQRAMTEADMERVTAEFVTAARLARDAGFDAVELHMGHGYLLNQFISPLSNRRRDEYGGSALNRVRFPARVLAAVKQAVGDTTAVLAAGLCAVSSNLILVGSGVQVECLYLALVLQETVLVLQQGCLVLDRTSSPGLPPPSKNHERSERSHQKRQ